MVEITDNVVETYLLKTYRSWLENERRAQKCHVPKAMALMKEVGIDRHSVRAESEEINSRHGKWAGDAQMLRDEFLS